ncbi:MAG: M1 family metallopeptidase, partial [Terriglobales bacterium]
MKRIAVLLCVLWCLAVSAAAQRLPGNVVPEHYDLTFTPDLPRATFAGEAVIKVRVLSPTDRITLHALEIEFTDVTVRQGKSSHKAKVTLDAKSETATFHLPAKLAAGPAQIHIRYNGILNSQLRGFYLSKGKSRNYAGSQMEATDARRAFPSFDEPALKASFAIRMIVDQGDTAISNGRIVSDTPGPGAGKHTLKFSRTPKMSAYLVALAVGD